MNIKKLDKRFKLYKLGLATHMAEVASVDINVVKKIMGEAYGPGQFIDERQKHVANKRNWFYGFHHNKIKGRELVDVTGGIGPMAIFEREVSVLEFRIYFRREEQAMFLALKQI